MQLPPAAGDAAWKPHLQQALKQHTFKDKLGVLSVAAASGDQTNLALAWNDLLQPRLHPELLQRMQGYQKVAFYDYTFESPDPGTAAVRAGHATTVLPLLVHKRCPLHPGKTIEAAAQHCNLAGLQVAWELLDYSDRVPQNDVAEAELFCTLAKAAGLSGGLLGHDMATAKLAWLLSVAPAALLIRHRPELLMAAAVGAAAGGAMSVLTWLRGQGLDLPGSGVRNVRGIRVLGGGAAPSWAVVLAAALQGGHVPVADWLVGEAGCPVPSVQAQDALTHVWIAAVEGGHLGSVRWLVGRGLLPGDEMFVLHAAQAGRLDAVRFLHQECGVRLMDGLFLAAAGSRSVPTAAWLLQAGCPMDPYAYVRAAQKGDADMVAWLAQVGCPWGPDTLASVISCWKHASGAPRQGLQRAVAVLEEAGCPAMERGGDEVEAALEAAAARGDLWLLHRLHRVRGLGLGGGTLAAAAGGGCEVVLEWVVEVVGQVEDSNAYVNAGRNGDMCTLECLHRLGVGFGPQVLCEAVQAGVPLPLLAWLVERGASWNEAAAKVVESVAWAAKGTGRYGASVAWLEARLGREVRQAGP